MGTTAETIPRIGVTVNRRALCVQIEQWRNNLLDCELHVDDTRLALNRAVEELREAVRERDRAAAHLARLIDWHDEIESVAETFGPEIADTFAQQLEARG